MDLKQIRYFVAVAEAGSFSRGAKRAFVTQPTLSAAIRALEAEIGFRLLDRTVRGVSLTMQGVRTLEHARVILREAERLRAADNVSAGQPLKIGLLATLPDDLVANTLTRLKDLTPLRALRIEDASVSQLQQRLASGRYDLIFSTLGAARKGHRQLSLARDRQALAVPASDLATGAVSPRVLHARPLIVRTHCENLHDASRILDRWKVKPIVVSKTDSDSRAQALVAAGIGSCLMPSSFRHPGLSLLPVRGVDLQRHLGLEWIRGAAEGWLDKHLERLAQSRPVSYD